MREVINRFNIYNFEELDEKAKEKVKEKMRETIINLRFMVLQDDLKEILFNDYKIEADVYYSLGYSQGDGLHFVTDNLLSDYVINEIKKELTATEKRMFSILLKNEEITAFTKHFNNFYEYASKYDVKLNCYFKESEYKNNLIDKIENRIQNIYLSICNKLEKIGYNCYNVTDEDVAEEIKANKLEFYDNGLIY